MTHIDAMSELLAYAWGRLEYRKGRSEQAYHWLDVRMWHCFELDKVKFQFTANIDVCALVIRNVAIFRC